MREWNSASESSTARDPSLGVAPAVDRSRAFWIALALGLFAAAARLPVALRESLWHDECLTRNVALLPWSEWWAGFASTESSPPLFFLLARCCASLFGDWTGDPPAWLLPLRLPSIVAASMAPVVLFLGTRRRLGDFAGLVGALLLAISPWLVWHGAEARPYALWTLALTGLLVATLDLVAPLSPPDRSPRASLRWTCWGLTALATHYFAALPLAMASMAWGAAIAMDRRGVSRAASLADHPAWTPWLAANGGLAIAAIPLALLLRSQLAGGHTAYISDAPLKDLGRTFLVVFPFELDAALARPLRLLGAAAMAGIVAAAAWRMVASWRSNVGAVGAKMNAATATARRNARREEALALAWLVLPTLGLFLFSRFVRPVFLYDRYPIMGLPALALLASLALREAPEGGGRIVERARRLLGAACAATLLFCAAWQAVRYVAPERGTLRENWLALPAMLRAAGLDVAREARWWTPDELVAEAFRHNAAPSMRRDARVERTLDDLAPLDGDGADGVAFAARPATLAASAEELGSGGLAPMERWRGDDLVAGRLLLIGADEGR